RTMVDEAKALVETDKSVLCLLADGGPGPRIDDGAIFVRGRRDQYPETWWRAQIEEATASTMERNAPYVAAKDGAWMLTVPVKIKGRAIGVLAAINPRARPFREDQVSLMAVLGAFAGIAIENSRLHEQASYALLADERSRIAKDMHDGLSQQLFSVSLELDVCRKRLRSRPDEVERRLERQQAVVVRSLSELRRYIYDLRPLSLDRLGLAAAMRMRVMEISEAAGIAGRLQVDGASRRLPPGVEACLYRVAQEAVSNAARHAQASRVIVTLRFGASTVLMVVEDDGIGFTSRDRDVASDSDSGMGLANMRDRVAAEGGSLDVVSGDSGTTVTVDLPC
ncbi:MAG: GAF domain-containing sensor histidine kinase, partial [Coriobacteriia bacterium]|nr:GAF domain-containing sensor histidine kinase [Coriobacteriia bacterium]